MNLAPGYPVPRSAYRLHLTSGDCALFHAERHPNAPKQNLGFSKFDQWKLPAGAATYLSLCDGRTSHREIATSFAPSVHPLFGELLADHAALSLQKDDVISFSEKPVSHAPKLTVTGDFDSYAPLHISFEITDTCNFRCDHCYVSASPEKHGRKNGAGTIRMLEQLAKNGVVVVELTGGECTTHPEFKDILHYASNTFYLVGIISNGYLMGKRPDLVRFIADHANVVVQISIDGLRDFHDHFRKMPGAFDAACHAIGELKRFGTFVRIGMSVTPDNLDQVVGVFHLARSLRADALGIAAVTSFGRATNLLNGSAMEHHITHRIEELLAPFRDDPLFDAVRQERESARETRQINCGAGWRSFALNSDGTVRSCLYLADSKKFGSIDGDNFEQLFRSQEMRLFHDAPSPGGPECQGPQPDGTIGCKHLGTCIGCFAKALRISESEYPECPWRARYFPGMSLKVPAPSQFVPVEQLLRSSI